MMKPPLSHLLLNRGHRSTALGQLDFPATPSQLARRTGLSDDACSAALIELCRLGLARCVNPEAARFRLFVLTREGRCRWIDLVGGKPTAGAGRPIRFWRAYAEVLYPHRSAIIRTLTRPLQAAEIKRLALRNDARLRMSAGNVRDVLRVLREKGIVRRLSVPRSAYPRWELTELGHGLRAALLEAGRAGVARS